MRGVEQGNQTVEQAGVFRDPPDRLVRIGHKGAALLAPGNTIASFDAARLAGVDAIELDVLSEHPDGGGELYVAHDYGELAGRRRLTFAQALAHLASSPFDGVALDVDLKRRGYELRVVHALAEHGLLERSLISSFWHVSLARLRASGADVRIGWSVPRVRRDWTALPLAAPVAHRMLASYRRVLPRRAAGMVRGGRCDAVMAAWQLVSAELVQAMRVAGGQLYAWTADDPLTIARLAALGVTGIISNDPRLLVDAADHPPANATITRR